MQRRPPRAAHSPKPHGDNLNIAIAPTTTAHRRHPQLMGIMATDIHLGRRPMNDHALPLAHISRWKWLGELGYSLSSPIR